MLTLKFFKRIVMSEFLLMGLEMISEMNYLDAVELFRLHSEWLSENWLISPEGREYKRKFDAAIEVIAKYNDYSIKKDQ